MTRLFTAILLSKPGHLIPSNARIGFSPWKTGRPLGKKRLISEVKDANVLFFKLKKLKL